MRVSLAGVCAAVLVGLSPAGALPFASVAAAAVCVDQSSQRAEGTGAARNRGDTMSGAAAIGVPIASQARVPSIFRSPSGPAPSQAPPARA